MGNSTPGPWMVHQTTKYNDGWLIEDGLGYLVGIIPNNSGREVNFANARLIAAAPELLDVVEALSRAVKDGLIVNSTDEDSCGVLLDFARDALAKATGEQS